MSKDKKKTCDCNCDQKPNVSFLLDNETNNQQTTKEEFEKFKKICNTWLEILGCTEWVVEYLHEETENYAEVFGDVGAKRMWVRFTTDWGEELSEKQKDKTLVLVAEHEAIEVLLYVLRIIAGERTFSEIELDGAVHSIINRIQKVIRMGLTGELKEKYGN